MSSEEMQSAGVGRRFAAMVYDALLLVALWLVVSAFFTVGTHGEAVQTGSRALRVAHQSALLIAWIGFYGLFWRRSGQTLGMLAWRLKLVPDSGAIVTWRDVLVRLAVGVPSLLLAGLGFFWLWFDRDRLTWHDRASHTRVIVLPKAKKAAAAS